jgi:predicted permease
MAQEMGADAELAGQLVVFTTITSAFTVFVTSFLLRAAGIF